MNCGSCGQYCAEEASFCGACGQPLVVSCPRCERKNPAGNRFCQHCGMELGDAAPDASPPSREEPDHAQRRHLTVMFVDLVGSTPLAERLDVEDVRAVVRTFHDHCGGVIGGHDGTVVNYVGDGVLAFFGYPTAHEDDAVQAVRAGLRIVEAMPSLGEKAGVADLAARVGIHSGVTVVGATGSGSARLAADAVGELPNIAARLQAVAGQNQVVISGVTRSAVEGFFHLESLGTPELKGVSRRVEAALALGETAVRTRLDAVAQRGFTPLVGRDRELGLLLDSWDRAKSGDGRVVIISGEPGIGKSRILRELRDRIGCDAVVVELQCSPRQQHSGLQPLIDHLRRAIDAGNAPGDADRLGRIEDLVDMSHIPRDPAVPIIAGLLDVDFAHRYDVPTGSPELRKRLMLETATALLFGLSKDRPVLLTCEDVHWMDSTTLEMVDRLIDEEPVPGLLTIVTQRSEFSRHWPDYAHVERLTLNRLATADARRIIDLLCRDHEFSPDLAGQIVSRTDGVPLFVEELTQMLIDAEPDDASAGDDHRVPVTLRESIMARLDRLGPARELAQLCAAIGREFSYDFLGEVWDGSMSIVDEGLRQLVDAGLAYQRGSGHRAVFVFKHALVQDVAYDSLLRSMRGEYHRRIAAALLGSFAEDPTTTPEIVAQHCALGGLDDEAIVYWRLAGERALARFSPLEGIVHLRRALDLLATRPESPDRDRAELTLLTIIGPPLAATRGYASFEVDEVYRRASFLCGRVDDVALRFVALYGVFRTHLLRAEYEAAEAQARELLYQAEASGERDHVIAAHRAMGGVLFYRGVNPNEALRRLELALRADEPVPDPAVVDRLRDIADPGVTCRAYAAWCLWMLDRRAEAREMSDAAIERAHAIGHPFTQALALCFDLWVRQFEGDVEELRCRAEAAVRFTTEQGFVFWYGWARVMLGWAHAQLGDPSGGVALMEQGLVEWQATGSKLGRTYFLGLLAEGLVAAGRADEAEIFLNEAIRLADDTGEGFWLPRLLHLETSSRVVRQRGRA